MKLPLLIYTKVFRGVVMKLERSDIEYPLWRKKVDSLLFKNAETPIPLWACDMWKINDYFFSCTSDNNPRAKVKIIFENNEYEGYIRIAVKRKNPAYRLSFSKDLQYRLKRVFLMSFMRDIEFRLRNDVKINIEEEIPFWEFLDIEYDTTTNIFYFSAYYTQKPSFPELFKRIIEAPYMNQIDDELNEKDTFRIYKQGWKPREELEYEIEVENVLYTLIDTDNKLIYIGEASKLVKRLQQNHPTIRKWNYYRYDVLPLHISKHRKQFERMLIRDLASILESDKNVSVIEISDYKLANSKIDL
jgi:hypothetical protein